MTRHGTQGTRGAARAAMAVAAIGATAVLLLTGCSSSGGSASSLAEPTVGSAAANGHGPQAPGLKDAGGGASSAGSGGSGQERSAPDAAGTGRGALDAAQLDPTGRKITRDASLVIRVKDIRDAASRVESLAGQLQGYVLSEQVGDGGEPVPDGSAEPDFGGQATITLSVPADRLDQSLRRLAGLGTVTERSTTSEDVTGQYVDTQSRLATQRLSVDRVRALMNQAKSIKDVVLLESELSRREADLESLEAQLTALKGEVARSTVDITLSTTATAPPAPASTPNGFVEGLAAGWHGFLTAVGVVVTALGLVLPFAVAVAVALVPLLWWLRRRRQHANGPSLASGS